MAESLDEATAKAMQRTDVLEWPSWDLVDAGTGMVIARCSEEAGVVQALVGREQPSR